VLQKVDLRNLKITIVGLGLMGGSMAMALKKKNISVSAVDPDLGTIEQALASGTIIGGTSDLRKGIKDADLIVLAMPVGKIIETITELPKMREGGCVVLDLGSTKAEICETMSLLPERFVAIGGHPMCGRELSGFNSASPNLYEGQTFILCTTKRTNQPGIDTAMALIQATGAQPAFLEASIHDEITALTSHLPYLLSLTLISLVARKAMSDSNFWKISATGLRDTVRLAGSNPQMMLEILESNQAAILANLKEVRADVDHMIQMMEEGDKRLLEEHLFLAKGAHDLYLRKRWADNARDQ